jgi:hypothetical protein
MHIEELISHIQAGTQLQNQPQPSYTAIAPDDLIPVGIVPEEYPHLFNPKQWLWLLRKRDANGLDHAIVVLGKRRLFLSKSRFAEWLSTRAEQGIRS